MSIWSQQNRKRFKKVKRSYLFQSLVTLMRILFGFGWLLAGITKITGKAGAVSWFKYPNVFLTEYLSDALQKPNVPEFYKTFIESNVLHQLSFYNYSIPITQIVVGVGLIVGFGIIPLVCIALFMQVNFIISGNMNLLSLTLYTSAFGLIICIRWVYTLSLDRVLGLDKWFFPNRMKNDVTVSTEMLQPHLGMESPGSSTYQTNL